jgi:hypothetical protein
MSGQFLRLPRESAVRHGRIAAIFWLSNSVRAGAATICGAIVDNVRRSIRLRSGMV